MRTKRWKRFAVNFVNFTRFLTSKEGGSEAEREKKMQNDELLRFSSRKNDDKNTSEEKKYVRLGVT